MAASLGSLRVDLIANIARFERGLSRAERLARQRSRAIQRSLRAVRSSIASLGVGVSFANAIGSFAEFEKGLVAVGKTANLQGKALQNLGDDIQKLGRTLPVATSRLLELAGTAGQVGVKGTSNILKFTKVMGQLELATDVAGEEGAKSIVRLLNVTGEAISTVDTFGNVLTRLGNNAAASESEILAVAQRVGEATAVFGLSSSEILALGAALKSVGARAESAGTTIGKVFQEMAKAANDGGTALKVFADISGLTIEEFKSLRDESPVKALEQFVIGLGKLSETDALKALKALKLDGDRVIATLGSLSKGADELTKALELTDKELKDNNALFKESIVAASTFSAKMQVLGNVANEAAVEIGNLIAPAALGAVEALSTGAKALSDNLTLLKDTVSVLAIAIGGKLVGGLAAAAKEKYAIAVAAQTATASAVQLTLTQAKLAVAMAAATGDTAAFGVALARLNAVLKFTNGSLLFAVASMNKTAIAAALAARAMTALRSVMAFFGGPIGAAITAIGAAWFIVSKRSREAEDAQEKLKAAMEAANNVGRDQIEISKEMARAKTNENIAILEGAQALVREQLIKKKAASTAGGQPVSGGELLRLRQLGEEYQGLTNQINKLKQSLEGNIDSGEIDDLESSVSGLASTINGLGDSLKEIPQATEWQKSWNSAFDAIDAQFAELDAAQALKDAGLDDEQFRVNLEIRNIADQEDPTREILRDIQNLESYLEKAESNQYDLVLTEAQKDIISGRILTLQEEVDDLLSGIPKEGDKSASALAEAFENAAGTIERSITDAVLSASLNLESLRDLANSVLKQIAASLIQSQVVGPLSTAIQAGAASFFGARASGGPVAANQSYLVGEKGPEVITMGRTSGFVTPNDKLGGSSSTVVNITNNTNAEAKVQRSNSGTGREIIDVVIGEVNANIAGGGSIARTLQNSFSGFSRRSISRS